MPHPQSQKKQQFRFRIPWITGSAARPATESQSRRPKQRSKSPSKSDIIQRPPFRPPGIAPASPRSLPTQAQGTPRPEPEQPSPTSSVIIESPLPSTPSTPSPSHASSPSHLSPKRAPEASTHPASSPLKTITKSPETSETMSTHPRGSESQFHISKTQVASQYSVLAEESTLPASSSTQQEKGREPKMKSPLKIIPSELEVETKSKSHQSKEKLKMVAVQEPIKLGKANNNTKLGQPIGRSKAKHHISASSGVQATKVAFTRALRADKKQKEASETVERKMMFATSNPSGKDIKVVSPAPADPVTNNVSSSSIPFQNIIKDDISKLVDKVATMNPTETESMDDKTISVVTLAGDNRGATMHVGSQSSKKQGSIHIHRAYKTNPAEDRSEATSDGEENSSSNSMEKDEVGKAYVNSNIQSVNNSMMLHGSVSERDPGVRVILPQQPAEPIKPVETRRTEVNIRRAEKSSYQPVIRRRCLGGLFLEPSDSDPDNPDKPRRHGCKFRCGETTKDKDSLIL